METDAFVLVVDDDAGVRDCIKRLLESAGYQVWAAGDGIEALGVLDARPVDLVLADIAMPRMNGYQLYECVVDNPRWVVLPFVLLTARALDSDIRYGTELGVDGYLTKPCIKEDLLAMVRGRLRRARQVAQVRSGYASTSDTGTLTLGDLRIDLGQHRVWLDERPVKLSTREFRLLACLAKRQRRVVPLEELVQVTHQNQTVSQAEAGILLRPLVRSLRRKLGYAAGQMGCIENVRGVGYQLIPPQN